MFNDDVLASCPECNSADTTVTNEAVKCGACGFSEPLVLDQVERVGMQNEVVNALNMAKARDVLQRWNFAG